MRTFKETETTYVCQFCKPANYSQLVDYALEEDNSGAKLAEFYLFAVNVVKNTPAFNQPGTVDMLNELSTACRKTKRPTSCGVQARKIKRIVDWYANTYAKPSQHYLKQKLALLTDEELEALKNS